MQFFDIPENRLWELFETELEELEFSVHTYCALKRGAYRTVADLAYLTFDELREVKHIGKRGCKEVQDNLKEWDILLMTREEKQQRLANRDDPEVLKRELLRMVYKDKESQETISFLKQSENDKWEEIRESRKRELKEARGIARTSPYPIARLLEGMYFGVSAVEGCNFCDIFALRQKHCFVEEDAEELEHSCEECIEAFLADYYWGKRMHAKLAEERKKASKMLRMQLCETGIKGRCPVCLRQHFFDRTVRFCVPCGSILNWDEEHWDEETREHVQLRVDAYDYDYDEE